MTLGVAIRGKAVLSEHPIHAQYQAFLSAYSSAQSQNAKAPAALLLGQVLVASPSFSVLSVSQQNAARDVVGALKNMVARNLAPDKAAKAKQAQDMAAFTAYAKIINRAKVDAAFRERKIKEMEKLDTGLAKKTLALLYPMRPAGFAAKQAQDMALFTAYAKIINRAKIDAAFRELTITEMEGLNTELAKKTLALLYPMRPAGFAAPTTTTRAPGGIPVQAQPAPTPIESTDVDEEVFDDPYAGDPSAENILDFTFPGPTIPAGPGPVETGIFESTATQDLAQPSPLEQPYSYGTAPAYPFSSTGMEPAIVETGEEEAMPAPAGGAGTAIIVALIGVGAALIGG